MSECTERIKLINQIINMEEIHTNSKLEQEMRQAVSQINSIINKYNQLYTKEDLKLFSEIINVKDKILDSCVYFLKDNNTGFIKIGNTKQLKTRIQQLKSAFYFCDKPCDLELIGIYPTIEGYNQLMESYFHEKFKEYRVHNEWFDLPFNIMNYIYDNYCSIKNKQRFKLNGVDIIISDIEENLIYDGLAKNYNVNRYMTMHDMLRSLDDLVDKKNKITVFPFLNYFCSQNFMEHLIVKLDKIYNDNITIYSNHEVNDEVACFGKKTNSKILTIYTIKLQNLNLDYWEQTI